MGRKNRYSADRVAEAIKTSEGNLSEAARRLECSRKTVHSYVNRFATVRDAYHEANESFLDEAEGQLRKAVKKGQLPAIMFALKTKGRNRGYVERQELQHEGSLVILNWDEVNENGNGDKSQG